MLRNHLALVALWIDAGKRLYAKIPRFSGFIVGILVARTSAFLLPRTSSIAKIAQPGELLGM
jgi:hypothetical protein